MILEAHPLLHGAAELQKALAHFIGTQARRSSADDGCPNGRCRRHARPNRRTRSVEQVLDGIDEVFRPQRHFVFRNVQVELAVDAEASDAAEAIAIRVVELFVEQRLGLFQLRRIAGTQPLIDPQQGLFMARGAVFRERS